jgi:UDP-N-acetylglucosamine 1-carboxyvinyltransferase
MARYVIEGGRPLNGTVVPSGNKNEALPVLAACLLTKKTVKLSRVPRIGDVITFCEILADLGAKIEWTGPDTLEFDASQVSYKTPRQDLCAKVRASILLLGPLLARFGKVELPLPGGDVIGARRIDTHWEGIEALGGQFNISKSIRATAKKIRGTEYFLDEPSVTATENLIMLATCAEGETTLVNVACEPHVVGLCRLLVAMGAQIDGIGTNRLHFRGVSELHGAEYEIGADFMEVGSFVCLGAINRGRIKIDRVNTEDFRFINKVFTKLGIHIETDDHSISVDGTRPLHMKTDVGGRVGTIYSGPWPAFPTDLMSVAIVAATQSQGTMLFFEKMFEGRMFFTDKLIAMGAQIILCDPHRAVINGPSQLYGSRLSSPDIRAGMALLTASLCALGTSEIDNIYQIERGYCDIDKKLLGLGAALKRVDSKP